MPSLRKVEHECQYRGTKSETAMWISLARSKITRTIVTREELNLDHSMWFMPDAENPIICLGQALGSAARTISTSTLRASSEF